MEAERAKKARSMLENACELSGSGDRKDSLRLFRKAAWLGNIEAQVDVGNIYDDRDGVRKDFETARYWYRRAISKGSPEAAYNPGISYLNRGCVRWAKYWLQVAKAMGSDDADEQLQGSFFCACPGSA